MLLEVKIYRKFLDTEMININTIHRYEFYAKDPP